MEDCILLSRRGELCPMRLQQLRRATQVCQNELKVPFFFLTRHDRQNDPDILRLHQTNRWLQIPIPRFLWENTDIYEPTWMVEFLHASSTHFTDMHAASQWDLGKIPSFFFAMRWMFWSCVHNRIPWYSDLILSKYVFESVSASQWFLVCLYRGDFGDFIPPWRPMQIMVPRSEWSDFNDWVYLVVKKPEGSPNIDGTSSFLPGYPGSNVHVAFECGPSEEPAMRELQWNFLLDMNQDEWDSCAEIFSFMFQPPLKS